MHSCVFLPEIVAGPGAAHEDGPHLIVGSFGRKKQLTKSSHCRSSTAATFPLHVAPDTTHTPVSSLFYPFIPTAIIPVVPAPIPPLVACRLLLLTNPDKVVPAHSQPACGRPRLQPIWPTPKPRNSSFCRTMTSDPAEGVSLRTPLLALGPHPTDWRTAD